MMTFIKSS